MTTQWIRKSVTCLASLCLLAGVVQAQLTNVSINPNTGSSASGAIQSFTATYGDLQGSAELAHAYFNINTYQNYAGGGCYVQWDSASGTLWLANDPGNGWLGPLTPGSGGTLPNSQCTLYGTGSSVSVGATQVAMTMSLSFTPAFAGTRSTYMWADGTLGDNSTIEQTMGNWTVTTGGGPDLTLSKSHPGAFTQGYGAIYSLTVNNIGAGGTSGTVTVTDTLPTGLTAGTMGGDGWSCTPSTATCSRSDSLAPYSSYPAIILGVNVAANAPLTVTNSARVSGGGETNAANDQAYDLTTINISTCGSLASMLSPTPNTALNGSTVTFTWNPSCTAGAQYTLSVGSGGWGTSDILGAYEYTYVSQVVSGIPTDNRTIYVRLSTYLGDGWHATDYTYTAYNGTATPVLTIAKSHTDSFSQGHTATYTITVSNIGSAAASGTVTVTDTLPTGLTAATMSGSGWNCTVSTATCTATGPLAAGGSYPITLTVNVANSAPPSVVNSAGVWSGGSLVATASDVTTITGFCVTGAATMISPAAGARLSGSAATFTWNPSCTATQYYLYLSTSGVGLGDLQSINEATSLSQAVGGLPSSGTLYVRLWSFLPGGWQTSDYTYLLGAVGVPTQVTLSSPATGAGNQSTTPTLSWAPSTNATAYDLYLGTSNPPLVYAQNLSGTSYPVTTPLNAAGTYYWYVVAKSSAGSAPASALGWFSTAGTAPGQVTLSSPATGAGNQSTTPTLSWAPSTNATWYDLYLGTSNPPQVYASNWLATSLGVSIPLTAGTTYYWNVVAKNSAGSAPASGTWSFNTAGSMPTQVTLSAPATGAPNQSTTPTLSWSAPANDTLYDLYLGTINPPQVYASNLTSASFTPVTPLTPGTTYYWDVVGKNSAGSAPASGISSFTTAIGGSCAGGSQTFTGTTSWTVPAGCNSATFEVWGGGAGGGSGWVAMSGGGGGGGYQNSGSIAVTPGNSYSITVAAAAGSDSDGNLSVVQLGGSIVIATTSAHGGTYAGVGGTGGGTTHTGGTGGAPTSANNNGAGGGGGAGTSNGSNGARPIGSPGIGGLGGSGAGQGGDGGTGDYSTTCTNGNPGVAPGGGGGGGGYDGGSGCSGGVGAPGQAKVTWSSTGGGSPPPPGQVTLSSPASGTNQSTKPTLSWVASSGATLYDLFLGTINPPTGAAAYAQNLSTTSFAVTTALNAGVTYWWSVVAKNSAGSALASTPWSFITAVPAQVTLTSPSDGAQNQSITPTLSWAVSSGATSYDLFLGTSNPPTGAAYAQNLSGTSYQVTTPPLNAAGTYYWQVVAKNSAGSAPASNPPWRFTTASGGGTCAGGSQTVTGTTSWTVPANCTQAIFEVWGGGGGGGTSIPYFSHSGTGGGGGGYGKATFSVIPGDVYNVTVPASGTSSIAKGGSAMISVPQGGIGDSGNDDSWPSPGAGASPSFGSGASSVTSSTGASGTASYGLSGGDGGSGAGPGAGAGASGTGGNGADGNAPGGGGAGGGLGNGTQQSWGGAGAAGQAKVTWSGTVQTVQTVAVPTFSPLPLPQSYTSAQMVTLSTTTAGASIRYTTDGSTPTATAGILYTGAISVTSTTTIKAIAYEAGWLDSSVASGTFTITITGDFAIQLSPSSQTVPAGSQVLYNLSYARR